MERLTGNNDTLAFFVFPHFFVCLYYQIQIMPKQIMKTLRQNLVCGVMALFFAFSALPTFAALPQNVNGQAVDDIVKELKEYVETVRTTWQIPGMAAAVALDGKVIFSEGFGVKENGGNTPVDANTIFQIGSVSKSFTATLMASLVAEGKVKWNDTIKNILPDFKMYDSWVTENMQVKDIMTHKSGIAEQVGTYIPNLGYDRDDLYEMFARIKPSYSFRGDFQYNNITFVIASKIIEKVTGKSWEENMQERVFNPLMMSGSGVNGEFFKANGASATPHEYYYANGKVNVNALHGDDQALWWLTVVGPAGSVCSSANDLIKYAEFHRLNGKVGEEQVIPSDAVAYLHKGQSISSQNEERTTLYGHCWYVEQNNRYRLYFHTGTTWGMTALCYFVPQLKLSGVILVGCEAGTNPRYAIMRRTIDLMMGAPVGRYSEEFPDYNSVFYDEWIKARQKSEAEYKGDGEKVEVKPAPANKMIVGKYTKDKLFGDATIVEKEDGLYITIGKKGFTNKLKHRNGNTFTFWSDGHEFPINFKTDKSGKRIAGFEVEFYYGEEKYLGGWRK